MCQIEVERREAIAARYDADRTIPPDSLPDPWQPLRELTSNLLPHLSFDRIDSENRDAMRVLWQAHSKETLVDLDDLSSGEKAVIQLFYPLLETRMKDILRRMAGRAPATQQQEICVLIDEPELHLHPNLQMKVFDYLRLLTAGGLIQVVVATHSPTIVEYASFDELYLLRPFEAVAEGGNQLVKVAGDEERLTFLRTAFGTTSNLTAMQSLVVVEGTEQSPGSKTVSDRKLFRALHPGFDRITLIAGGGKAECIKLRDVLDSAIKDITATGSAIALLDRDTAGSQPPPGVHYLPVSMIENFLLDPLPLWETLQSVIEKTSFKTLADVEVALNQAIDTYTPLEIDRRALSTLGTFYFRPKSPLTSVIQQVVDARKELESKYDPDVVAGAIKAAEETVAQLKSTTRRREGFHGKDVLDLFRKTHLHQTGMSEGIFRYESARHARGRKTVVAYFDDFFAQALPSVQAPKLVK